MGMFQMFVTPSLLGSAHQSAPAEQNCRCRGFPTHTIPVSGGAWLQPAPMQKALTAPLELIIQRRFI